MLHSKKLSKQKFKASNQSNCMHKCSVNKKNSSRAESNQMNSLTIPFMKWNKLYHKPPSPYIQLDEHTGNWRERYQQNGDFVAVCLNGMKQNFGNFFPSHLKCLLMATLCWFGTFESVIKTSGKRSKQSKLNLYLLFIYTSHVFLLCYSI